MAARKKRATRGPKGDGYVTWAKGRNRWRAVVRDMAGRGISKYFREQADAEAWRREQLAERDRVAVRLANPDDQVLNYAIGEWTISRMEYVAPATLSNIQQHTRAIAHTLGNMPMRSIWIPEIATFDKANRAKYVGAVAGQILTTLSAIFERYIALHPDTAIKNPVRAYRTVTPARARKGRPMRTRQGLDVGMLRMLIRHIDNPMYVPIVIWLSVTGMRSGELRGLRHANAQNGVALICEQRTKENRWESTPILKTEESHRSIPIPAVLYTYVPAGDDLLFPNKDGGAWPQGSFRQIMDRACVRAKIRHTTPHELRHTCTDGLLNLGCPWHYVAALLGHTPVKFAASLGLRIASQTSEYGGVGVEALRPWVDQWAALVLPERVERLREAR